MSNFEDWKNKERGQIIAKRFGLKFNIDALSESKKEYDLDENATDRIFAPNHYCAHHVRYEGREAHTVDHNWNEELQEVTQYDIKFEDGTVMRDVPASELEILVAMDEGSHGKRDHPPAKRDGKLQMKKDTEDADEDGSTDDEVPAFLDKGDSKKKKKSGKVPPQLQKHVKGRKKSKKDDDKDVNEQLELKELIKQQIRVALEEIKNES